MIFIKVESESRKTVVNDDLGAHCRILLSSCSLTLLLSATPEVNEGARQMRSKEGQAVVSETRKEVEVVRKELRNRERMESRNSLRNELDFIYYIKERACSDLSVYYLESGKKKEEAEYVLMDYYPHNLRQMLASQGALLSARHRLSLLTRITAALNWLAGNHICHRDLKPENIMLTQRRLPKLIDFGSCCPVNGNSTHFQVTETRRTPPHTQFSAPPTTTAPSPTPSSTPTAGTSTSSTCSSTPTAWAA